MAVMAFHLQVSYLTAGFAGVDVFFVISGYVVSKSLAEREYQSLGSTLSAFYARRISRIIPALIVMLFVVSILTVLFIPASWLSKTTSITGLSAFAGVSNIALILSSDGYFSPRADFNPFVHTWSLGVEEQFYLLFPPVYLLWLRWREQSGLQGVIAWTALPLLSIASLYSAYWMADNAPDWGYYLLPSRFWELAAGAMLYQCHAHKRLLPHSDHVASLQLIAGLALLTAGLVYSDKEHFPYPWALLPVLGTVLAINAIIAPKGRSGLFHRLLRCSAIRYLGTLSYSLYLWHWPVYTLMRWTSGLESLVQQLFAVSLTLLLSILSYHIIEKSLQQFNRRRQAVPSMVLAIGLSAITLLFFSSQSLFEHREQLSLSQTRDSYNWYAYKHPVLDVADGGQVLAGRRLFAIGDSHTGAYSTLFNEAKKRLGIAVASYFIGPCNVGNMLYAMGDNPACKTRLERAMAKLKKAAKPGDIVILASLRSYRLSDHWWSKDPNEMLAYSASDEAASTLIEARAETSALIKRLQQMQLEVIIDAPKPVFSAPPFRCADWFNRDNPICQRGLSIDRTFLLQLRGPVMTALIELTQQHPNLHLWDPLPILCPNKICSAFDASAKPLFFDGDHLSGHGNRVLYPDFSRLLKEIWLAGPATR